VKTPERSAAIKPQGGGVVPDYPTLGALARTASLSLASLLTMIAALFPALLMRQGLAPAQALLPMMGLGIAGGLIHGLGFRPRGVVAQVMLGPWSAWPLMAATLAYLTLAAP
jgi:predicted membrane protein